MIRTLIAATLSALMLAGWGQKAASAPQSMDKSKAAPVAKAAPAPRAGFDAAKLKSVMADARREQDRARDPYRHTAQTLAFFGIAPDMEVAEVLPGGGWYTRVLLPYLTPDGGWYGLNYSLRLNEASAARAGRTLSDSQRAKILAWPKTYPGVAAKFGPPHAAIKGAMLFDAIPDDIKGTLDGVLYFRALHHLNRFDPAIFKAAIADSYALLKPGGIVGVVQHRAKEDYGDKDYDTSGNKGYMKQSYVIDMFEKGGFLLDGESEMNANPEDSADYEGGVWTLPPSLRGKDKSMRDHYRAIGESDRMTLRFRKPL